MTDYISREAAIEAAMQDTGLNRSHEFNAGCARAANNLKAIPAVDAVPVVHGRWKVSDAYPHKVYCGHCYSTYAQEQWTVWNDGTLPRNYCPNCGAKMDEDGDEDGEAHG